VVLQQQLWFIRRKRAPDSKKWDRSGETDLIGLGILQLARRAQDPDEPQLFFVGKTPWFTPVEATGAKRDFKHSK